MLLQESVTVINKVPVCTLPWLFQVYLNLIKTFTFFVLLDIVRKFTSIVAAFIILVSATGMTISFHYCGKSLQDVAVFGKTKPCCGGMEMPSGCCHNEKVEVKSDSFKVVPQISNAGFVSFLIHETAYPVLDFSLHFQYSQSNFLARPDTTHPPDGSDIVILVQSFLI